MGEELSLIRFNVINLFSLILNQRPFSPVITTQMKIVEALIHSESEPDKKTLTRLEWIKENTHEKVKVALPIVELAVFRNLDKGLNKEIEIGNKSYSLVNLYKYLNEVSHELVNLTIAISKKYNVDIPMNNPLNSTQKISLE